MTRIVIVGAGIAGLNAALTLQDAGLACEIYEASNYIGGRMHSETATWRDGMTTDWCGEFIDGDHSAMRQLVRRFNLPTIDLGSGRGDRTQSLMYFFGRYYGAEELLRDFQNFMPLVQQQFQQAGFPTTHTHFTAEGARLDQLSVYEWIEQYLPGGHATPAGHLLETACTGFYGLDAREQSALNLVYMFGARESEDGPAMAKPLEGSCKIAGGNQRLPLAIARSLPPDSLHLQHQLLALARQPDDTLLLTFMTENGPLSVACDAVILTLPFSALRHVDCQQAGFDALKQTAIAELGYGTISKLFLQFDQPYWQQKGPWPSTDNGFIITDLEAQTFWDTSSGQVGEHGLLVNYRGGQRGAAFAPSAAWTTVDDFPGLQDYARDCLQQLELIFPGISAHYTGRAALSYPTGAPWLRGSYACWRVGQYTRFAGYERVSQGPTYFAGEHCSVEFQGYMEGAAREGARAAQEIIQDGA